MTVNTLRVKLVPEIIQKEEHSVFLFIAKNESKPSFAEAEMGHIFACVLVAEARASIQSYFRLTRSIFLLEGTPTRRNYGLPESLTTVSVSN